MFELVDVAHLPRFTILYVRIRKVGTISELLVGALSKLTYPSYFLSENTNYSIKNTPLALDTTEKNK